MDEPKCYFKKIHNQLEAGFNRAYKKYGLTSTQFDVLMYLSQEIDNRKTLSDIAAHFGVRHTSAIHVLKILEKKGFIRKITVQGARAKPILLTDSARQLISEVCQKSPLLDKVMFAGLSEADKQLLEKMLRQIYKNLESDAFKNL